MDKEVQRRCTACQVQGGEEVTGNETGGEVVVNDTTGGEGTEVQPLIFDINTYQLPADCQLRDENTEQSRICCSNATLNVSVCYDFDTINEYVDMEIPAFCYEMQRIFDDTLG